MEKIVGSYNPFRGNIINPIANMKRENLTDAYSTFVHEIQHLHFNLFSVIGRLIEILRVELEWTPESDRRHSEHINGIMNILCEKFNVLHEIYANSMELLWIEEYQGADEAASVYKRKAKKYQEYSKRFSKITRKCRCLEDKRNVIHELCIRAAIPDITTLQFVELMKNIERLEDYFVKEGNLEKKLQYIIVEYQNNQKIVINNNSIKLWDLISMLTEHNMLIYCNWLVEMSSEIISSMNEDDLTDLMENHYQDFLTQRTEVFNFEFIGGDITTIHKKWEEKYCCILKKHSRLLYPKKNYLVLGYSEKEEYIEQEVTQEELQEVIKCTKAILVDFDEFDIIKNQPIYFLTEHRPLFVLLTNYQQCENWISKILDEDLYFVDLFQDKVPNFYTLLFFRRRTEPNVIFIYPTLKYLAQKLINGFNLKDKIMFSSNQEALKIFAGFKDELNMLYAITWLFSFVSGSKWDGCELQKASSMLSLEFLRTLLDSSFQIRNEGYWMYKSALPTVETTSEGLYTLMEFYDGNNTGVICAQQHKEQSYPLFFRDKNSASYYKRIDQTYHKFKVMAVDAYYWKTLSKYLKYSVNKWCLYVNEKQGIVFDLDAYQSVINKLAR